jgi:hypothetical protein
MRTYDKRIRPSKNASQALNVTFGLALSQIIDVVCSVLNLFYLECLIVLNIEMGVVNIPYAIKTCNLSLS